MIDMAPVDSSTPRERTCRLNGRNRVVIRPKVSRSHKEQTMSTGLYEKTHAGSMGEIEVFRHSARAIHKIVRLNTAGVTQAESLIQPRPAGNCLNWVVGHWLCIYAHTLPLLGERPVMDERVLQRYDRGSAPIVDAAEARELSDLLKAWDETAERMDAGLAALTLEALDALAPFSPS